MVFIKRVQSYAFSCETYLYILLSLSCAIPLYLYYVLLGQTLNLLSFLIRSKINNRTVLCLSLQFLWILYFALRLLQHGDIELNPGPKYFSICHWNLNSLTAHNYLKVSQLQAFHLVYKFLCISETHLDSSVSKDDNALSIEGYSITRPDHPSNTKRGGVCIYYNDKISVRQMSNINLPEYLACESVIGKKKAYVITLYRSPSQNQSEFEHLLLSLENLLYNIRNKDPACRFLLGDFNARPKSRWVHDITNNEGTQIEFINSLYGFYQLISEPTHILQNLSPCIDLIFTDQPNLVINSGIKPSLHENCHHRITYAKFNLQIIYPPPYQRLVWDYKNANASSIQKALNMIDWNKLFSNTNVEKQVNILNDTLFNIFLSYARSKAITINGRDPPWINAK